MTEAGGYYETKRVMSVAGRLAIAAEHMRHPFCVAELIEATGACASTVGDWIKRWSEMGRITELYRDEGSTYYEWIIY